MAVNTEKVIQNMYDLKAKGVKYSMNGSRDGSDGTADCSGAVVSSLYKGGASKYAWLYNTDSMHDYLTKNGYKLIAHNKGWSAKRGDIVVFGEKGSSSGASGHVVIFISSEQIIHCNYSRNGVTIDNEETTCPYSMGWYTYRLGDTSASKPSGTKKKVLAHATKYSPSSKSAKIASFVKNASWTVKQERAINYSHSNREYLLVDNSGGIIGWVLSQDVQGGYGSDKVGSSSSKLKGEDLPNSGTYKFTVATNIRTGAGTNYSSVGMYKAGQTVNYYKKVKAGGYIWLVYTGGSGNTRYVAVV